MNRIYLLILIIPLVFSCSTQPKFNLETVDKAIENGKQANQGYVRSLKFTEGWLAKVDSASGLIPTNLTRKSDLWEPENSAADNYPFMVLTAYLLNKDLYNGEMLDMLKTEKKLTSRVSGVHDKFHKRLLKTKNSINKTSYKKHDIAFSHKRNII